MSMQRYLRTLLRWLTGQADRAEDPDARSPRAEIASELAEPPRVVTTVTAQAISELRRLVEEIQPLASALLGDTQTTLSVLGLRSKPVHLDGWVQAWGRLFAKAHAPHQDRLIDHYRKLLGSVWEAHGGRLGIEAYNAIEAWLRRHALITTSPPPRTSVGLLWFVAALYNWLWWQQNWAGEWRQEWEQRRRKKSTPEQGECDAWLEERLTQDVDRLLAALDDSPFNEVGDQIGMHLLGTRLRCLIRPPESARIRMTPQDKPARVEVSGRGRVGVLPMRLGARLETLAMFSPISVLDLTGTPRRMVDTARPLAWVASEKLLTDARAAGIRQYLSSHLGERLIHAAVPAERVGEMLGALESFDNRFAQATSHVSPRTADSWNEFLGQVLWSTLANATLRTMPELWARWSEGYPERISLAQSCGRLGRRAEALAQRCDDHRLPEWTCVWSDLAKVTLHRWVMGHDQAILCLGLWLTGYLNGDADTPPLSLIRRATNLTLEQLVGAWHGIARTDFAEIWSRDLNPAERDRTAARLCQVRDELEKLAAFRDVKSGIVEREVGRPTSAPDEVVWADEAGPSVPTGKIYMWTAEAVATT